MGGKMDKAASIPGWSTVKIHPAFQAFQGDYVLAMVNFPQINLEFGGVEQRVIQIPHSIAVYTTTMTF
jgi:hypothetical protein